MAGAIGDNFTREQYLFMAKLAERAERYEDMAKFMDKLVRSCTPAGELTAEERNLLSVAYKNAIGSLRATWRFISSVEQKEETRRNDDLVSLVKDYRAAVETELSQVCASIIELLDSNLIPSTSSSESKVFYLKLKGDYYRYLAEFLVGDKRREAADATMISYTDAEGLAIFDLPPMNHIRLGLALNFSVFHYEILNSCSKARDMARRAFDEAVAELPTAVLTEECSMLMQLLRDNLAHWNSKAKDQVDKS